MTDRTRKPFLTEQAPAPSMQSRWDGVLTPEQKAWCDARDIALAYDPLQIGWVIADIDSTCLRSTPATPLSWKVKTPGLLNFRRWQPSDVPAYMRLLSDPEVWQHMYEAWPGTLTQALARDLIDISGLSDHHDVLAVTLDAQPIGQMRLAFGADASSSDTAEISYWLGRDYWGRSLGRDLVHRATRRAFADHAWLYRLVAFVHPENVASAKCLRAAGYHDRGHRDDGWQCFVIYRDT
ncbi:GNAT family N-acetyltransferase [Roseovarius mucosus]|uniref:GNAT family N-acetyltransferase n=1 Tax=Roseovarius mucosus TaxID=215743 RepID=UPI001C5DF091|nr:GNAT family protein [Roseovarius mucosus]MBW4974523.1 GNAT family N-acetyltransferase [Roseovarius mucosus]